MSPAESHHVQLRWGDFDGLGHVNHVLAFTYFEAGRDAFLAGRGIQRNEYVVGRCDVTWREEILPGDDSVTVETAVAELGTSSLTTAELIRDARGRVAVEGRFGLVLWDPERRAVRPISEVEREALGAPVAPARNGEERR